MNVIKMRSVICVIVVAWAILENEAKPLDYRSALEMPENCCFLKCYSPEQCPHSSEKIGDFPNDRSTSVKRAAAVTRYKRYIQPEECCFRKCYAPEECPDSVDDIKNFPYDRPPSTTTTVATSAAATIPLIATTTTTTTTTTTNVASEKPVTTMKFFFDSVPLSIEDEYVFSNFNIEKRNWMSSGIYLYNYLKANYF